MPKNFLIFLLGVDYWCHIKHKNLSHLINFWRKPFPCFCHKNDEIFSQFPYFDFLQIWSSLKFWENERTQFCSVRTKQEEEQEKNQIQFYSFTRTKMKRSHLQMIFWRKREVLIVAMTLFFNWVCFEYKRERKRENVWEVF